MYHMFLKNIISLITSTFLSKFGKKLTIKRTEVKVQWNTAVGYLWAYPSIDVFYFLSKFEGRFYNCSIQRLPKKNCVSWKCYCRSWRNCYVYYDQIHFMKKSIKKEFLTELPFDTMMFNHAIECHLLGFKKDFHFNVVSKTF